jgi:hypothetical protein
MQRWGGEEVGGWDLQVERSAVRWWGGEEVGGRDL